MNDKVETPDPDNDPKLINDPTVVTTANEIEKHDFDNEGPQTIGGKPL